MRAAFERNKKRQRDRDSETLAEAATTAAAASAQSQSQPVEPFSQTECIMSDARRCCDGRIASNVRLITQLVHEFCARRAARFAK